MRYEEMVRRLCGDNWKTVNPEERDGGYGVACVMAFVRGNTKPSIGDIAAHLGTAVDDVVAPFTRLHRYGVFSQRFNARNDNALTSHPSDADAQRAWGHIAAVSGGLI